MGKLTNGSVEGQKLESGVSIHRYDESANVWFAGEVREISSFSHKTQQRVSGLALAVEGYAPSPLQEGDEIEILLPEKGALNDRSTNGSRDCGNGRE